MTNKHALYVLLAALVLAALTNRWLLDAPEPAFNAANLDTTFFDAQWVAFLMTAGGVVVLGANWQKNRQFPRAFLLGVALLLYFLATGIPYAKNAAEWARGSVGLALLTSSGEISGIASEVEGRAPRLHPWTQCVDDRSVGHSGNLQSLCLRQRLVLSLWQRHRRHFSG